MSTKEKNDKHDKNDKSDKNEKVIKDPEIKPIYDEIGKSMEYIDDLYIRKDFNLMTAVVDIFGGDVNFENVKLKIEDLNNKDEKLDQVIKLIVKQHSDEFYKILGFVREMKTKTESSEVKLSEAKGILHNIKADISTLNQESLQSNWKYKSIFYSELITKLNKTYQIFKIINECEVFIDKLKIFDCIDILKKNESQHQIYDKEFRGYNIIVNINNRFFKIKNNIKEKLSKSLHQILFFTDPKVLERKIASLNIYFLCIYSKISIDTELAKPIGKMLYIIKETVNKEIEDYNFNEVTTYTKVSDLYQKESTIELDSEKKLTSLIYLIKCLMQFTNSEDVFKIINNMLSDKLFKLIENIMKISGQTLKTTDFSHYNINSTDKIEKITFLLFFQMFLVVFAHLLIKLFTLNKYLKNEDITDIIRQMYISIENIIIIPLNLYFKLASPRIDEKENQEIILGENTIRMKINEYVVINKDYVPILLKVYFTFSDFFQTNYEIRFNQINAKLKEYNEIIFKDLNSQMQVKTSFDTKLFYKDFDADIANFKFINEFIIKINSLKRISIFAFDEGPMFIMKIFKDLYLKYFEDLRAFTAEMKSKCSYNYKFDLLYEEFVKLQDCKTVTQVLEFKKYTSEKVYEVYLDNFSFLNILMKFVFDIAKEQYDYNNLYIKEYKTMELFTKLISSSENIIQIGEGFIFELMKATYSKAKMRAYLEQVLIILFNYFIYNIITILLFYSRQTILTSVNTAAETSTHTK